METVMWPLKNSELVLKWIDELSPNIRTETTNAEQFLMNAVQFMYSRSYKQGIFYSGGEYIFAGVV